MSVGSTGDLLRPVLTVVTAAWPGADTAMIEDAYRVAEARHRGETRYSGDPLITHSVEVGLIVAKNGARDALVCAALLHETDYPESWLRDRFGPDVAAVVAGVNRADSAGTLASATDDVVLVKLADRLHNLQTVRFTAPEKQRRKAAQTLDVLVPVATQIGADRIGRELTMLASTVLSRPTPALYHSASLRVLVIASVLLPSGRQARWITEWAGELATITTRRRRLWFAATLLIAMPRLARTLRKPADRPESRHPIGITIVSGTSLAAIMNTNSAWAAATVVLGLLILTATVLLINSDAPARRIREIIETWRNRPPR